MRRPEEPENREREQDSQRLTRVERSLDQIKRSALFLIIGFLLSGVLFSGELARSIKDLRDLITDSSDALVVSEADSQARITRDLTETAWRRLYWSRNFLTRINRQAVASEIHEAWVNLLKSSEEMAAKTMVYSITLGQYYGLERRAFFENEIQGGFTNLGESLTKFRYSPAVRKLESAAVGTQPTLPPDQEAEIEKQIFTIKREIDDLNITLYQFASCFDKKHQTQNGCK